MSRAQQWVSSCPERTRKRICALTASPATVTQKSDPTRFSVCDTQGRRYTCSIGNPHVCGCGTTQPCSHVLSVLILFFGVAVENPLVWQKCITELELSELIDKRKEREKCVFCRERSSTLESCEKCGAQFHRVCLELASKSGKYSFGRCPGCSEVVPTTFVKPGLSCQSCGASCNTDYYACMLCPDFHLCRSCYTSSKAHPSHPFQRCLTGVPRPVVEERRSQGAGELQYREINPEDYDALLSLDSDKRTPLSPQDVERLHTECFCARPRINSSCPVCLRDFKASDNCIVLSCGHAMHQRCGCRWLSEYSDTCPIDKLKVVVRGASATRATCASVIPFQLSVGGGTASEGVVTGSSLRLPAIRPRKQR